MIPLPSLLILLISELVINEVYPNPPGPESGSGSPGDRFEFVEIFNNSNITADITGYLISDDDETDSIIPITDSTFLSLFPGVLIGTSLIPPNSFALILDSEFLMDSFGPFPFIIDSNAVLFTTTDTDIGNGLSNTDPILLKDPYGNIVSTYGTPNIPTDSIPLNPPDGVSIERVSVEEPDNFSNWRYSRWGASPGGVNSWSLNFNLGFLPDSNNVHPRKPSEQDSISIQGFVYNFGRATVSQWTVEFIVGPYIRTKTVHLELKPDSGTFLSTVSPPLPEGFYEVKMVLSDQDQDPSDDTSKTGFYSGKPPLVINEIMYNSQVEWIELFNRSSTPISLAGFQVVDSAGNTSGYLDEFLLNPQSFIVIADNQEFQNLFPGVTFLIPPRGLPSLNNTKDVIMVFDSASILMERVYYESSYGGDENLSLERLSPELPSEMVGNWASSRDPSGATPGRKNSVYTEINPTKGRLSLINRILSPQELGVLSYDFNENTIEVSLTLFDLRGRLLAKPVDSQSLPGKGQIVFDVPQYPGLYILFVDVRTAKGRIKKKLTFSVRP